MDPGRRAGGPLDMGRQGGRGHGYPSAMEWNQGEVGSDLAAGAVAGVARATGDGGAIGGPEP